MDLRPRRPSSLSLKLIVMEVLKKENGDGENLGEMVETWRGKREKELASWLSWNDLLFKLCELNFIGGFRVKLNSPRLKFEWLIFLSYEEGF